MTAIRTLFSHSEPRGTRSVSTTFTAMANPPDDDASMRRITTSTAKGDLVPGAAEERADFIRAVIVGINTLEIGRDISFDDAAIRLGLDWNEAPS